MYCIMIPCPGKQAKSHWMQKAASHLHLAPSGLRPLLLQLKKKVRVRKAADEEGAGLDLAALEAEAAAAGKSELGSRKDTAGRAAQAQKAQIADEAQRQSK